MINSNYIALIENDLIQLIVKESTLIVLSEIVLLMLLILLIQNVHNLKKNKKS